MINWNYFYQVACGELGNRAISYTGCTLYLSSSFLLHLSSWICYLQDFIWSIIFKRSESMAWWEFWKSETLKRFGRFSRWWQFQREASHRWSCSQRHPKSCCSWFSTSSAFSYFPKLLGMCQRKTHKSSFSRKWEKLSRSRRESGRKKLKSQHLSQTSQSQRHMMSIWQ